MLTRDPRFFDKWPVVNNDDGSTGWSVAQANAPRVLKSRLHGAIAYKKHTMTVPSALVRSFINGEKLPPPLPIVKVRVLPVAHFIYPHPTLPGHPCRRLGNTTQTEHAHGESGDVVLEIKPVLDQ